jgi:hypothetical protein
MTRGPNFLIDTAAEELMVNPRDSYMKLQVFFISDNLF